MLTLFPSHRRVLLFVGAAVTSAFADPGAAVPLALRKVNPDRLSAGLFGALDASGTFGPRPAPTRARTGAVDLSKGHPPAVLDARIGTNIRLGNDPSPLPPSQLGQAEPHLCRSAANPDLLLATFQEGRFSTTSGAIGCGYSVSRDGGLTWSRALIPGLTSASGGRYSRATDPVAAIGPQGDLYLNTLASPDNAFNLAAVVVSRSTDSGATWSAPVVVFQSADARTSPDKNWVAVNDYPGTPNAGRVVVTWTAFTSTASGTPTGNNIVASVSDDRGASWSAPTAVTPAGMDNQGSQPVFFPDGSLAVVYATFFDSNASAAFSLECKRSADGGRTFPAAATTVVPFAVGWDDPQIRDGVVLPAATVARLTGEIFVSYTALVGGSPRILVTKSSAAGATWSTPVIASDQPAGVSVMNPAIAVTPDGRAVSVVFMDRRNAREGAEIIDHYVAQSFDGGQTWSPNLRLTELASDIRLATPTSRGYMLGDYLGLAPSLGPDQPCVAIWCDTRTGDADPFTVRFAPVAEQTFEAWRTVHFTRGELANPGQSGAAADFDGDGVGNYLEFDAGTDPRVAESGETIVLSHPDADTLDVASAGRGDAPRTRFSAREIPVDPLNPAGSPPILVPAPLPLSSSAGQIPDVRPRPGLVWRSARFAGVRGKAIAVTLSAASGSAAAGASVSAEPGSALELGSTRENAASGTDARLINLATRGQVRSDAGQLIAGFVIDGEKSVLVRVSGPTLGQLGVSGTLRDPRLLLSTAGPTNFVSMENDNWSESEGVMAALFARVGAFPFVANSLDAALAATLGRRDYTARVSGADNSPGVALVEIYDADPVPGARTGSRLLNLSARAEVGTGDGALIAGFSLRGAQRRRVLIRAVGPSLAPFVGGGFLADPVLTLYRDTVAIAQNDDWEISRSGAAIAATARRVGAFALVPASLDAALLITLAPGGYTAIVTGATGTIGLALIEVYDAD